MVRELQVRLRFAPDDVRPIGTLAEDGRRVYFEVDEACADLPIAPYAWRNGGPRLRAHRPKPGVPIPGVFNDSRPDGWGLKLLHRQFQRHGRSAASVSPLEELAFLGSHTMGALTYHPSTGPSGDLNDAVALADLARHARQVYDDAVEEVLPELVRAGASSGGARPKALIGLRRDGSPGVRFGEADLPDDWAAWLVKFPASHEDPDVGRRESAWMRMAAAAGVTVPEHRVLRLDEVGEAFAVRRFERPGPARRLHMLSAAGALDVDFRTSFLDYRDLLRLTSLICSGDQSQVLAMYRLALFNVASMNDDDHLKNFAYLMDEDGRWTVAPGFDLTYAPHPSGARSTTVLGADRDIDRARALELAEAIGLPRRQAVATLDEVTAATSEVRAHLDASGCAHPVSLAAAAAVEEATARLR